MDQGGADGDNDDLDNLHHHVQETDLNERSGQDFHQKGCKERRRQCSHSGDGHGKYQIRTGDVNHYIGSQTA